MRLNDLFRPLKTKGTNNTVKISKNICLNGKINGNNNSINIGSVLTDTKVKIKLNIYGNNNNINIKSIDNCRRLNIDIGNFTGANNVTINIGERLICVETTILAYQSNVPITIGDDCLLSRCVSIRSGELPHVIYDRITGKDLDQSDGIFIGNNVWIGEGVYIMKNVTIQDHCVVGTAAVVTKRFTDCNVVIAGNPAKICKRNIVWAPTAASLNINYP